MHRFLYVARPRADLTAAEFQQRWREHSSLAAKCLDVLAEVRGYRQWQVAAPGEDHVVGVAETRCADAAAVYRMLDCASTREVLQPDELRFFATPCRQAGLVADDQTLCAPAAADAVLDHGCLWLASRAASQERIDELQAVFDSAPLPAARALSLGRRDAADLVAPFTALLFARFGSAMAAAAVTAAWREALQPGENVWQLQIPRRASSQQS